MSKRPTIRGPRRDDEILDHDAAETAAPPAETDEPEAEAPEPSPPDSPQEAIEPEPEPPESPKEPHQRRRGIGPVCPKCQSAMVSEGRVRNGSYPDHMQRYMPRRYVCKNKACGYRMQV